MGWFWQSASSAPSTTTTTITTLTMASNPKPAPRSLALSEVQLPETMSCRDAFDYAWHCHTVGSQWNAIYRYGTMRNCSDLWDDFWLCMRTRTYGAEQKSAAIKAHYREKEEKKYGGGRPSSEDVWQSRREPAQPGEAFQEKFAPPVHDDVEYQLAQLERRRKIREELGIASRPQDDSDKDH
ncbi:hypothetical protein B0T26DRAFT_256525 [Lasiosphaeria miniovina]|uniref:Early meiotic induction protein 1 n=1 Tax=Lasiosphaeria miniovina TaxID=1954250 RepID=A0AA40AWI7_9PEZI|nr:uncharacterized protein B0T26DRAFT_256525 [Lasiosphaeria miniovina]KAK0723241.1 hypothetical protein B0T26DRAFT_256525 [Lasiosphaeria miniovina]